MAGRPSAWGYRDRLRRERGESESRRFAPATTRHRLRSFSFRLPAALRRRTAAAAPIHAKRRCWVSSPHRRRRLTPTGTALSPFRLNGLQDVAVAMDDLPLSIL